MNSDIKHCCSAECDETFNYSQLARSFGWATFDGIRWLCPKHNPCWDTLYHEKDFYGDM